jgi:hypothetical protein
MGHPGEPINPYSLMFGEPVDCTILEVDLAFRELPAKMLLQASGLALVLGTAFSIAFGDDMRSRAVTGTFAAISMELDSRGFEVQDSTKTLLSQFEDALASLASGEIGERDLPTHRLESLHATVYEAATRLGTVGDPMVINCLRATLAAADEALRRRSIEPAFPVLPPLPPDAFAALERRVDPEPVPAFIAYAHEDARHRDDLVTHLAPLRWRKRISVWHDRRIVPGQDWENEIDERLETAKIFVGLISADFVDSGYCMGREMRRALERHQAGEMLVIPVLVRPTHWHGLPFAHLQMLPYPLKAITDWRRRDNAWTNVVQGIDLAIDYQLDRETRLAAG